MEASKTDGGDFMAVCGVIAEYDPFHRGHERHLTLAREKTGADFVIVVMSGSFTQRGMPALLPPHARAEMALRCGADVVLELPYGFSVREADGFARGSVGILHALECVTHLSFGCETDDLPLLQAAAALLEEPDEAFLSDVQRRLDGGLSFAAAQGQAVAKRLKIPADMLNAPNAALAVAYLRALRRLNSPIIAVPILRTASYRSAEMEAYPSAAAVRGALLRGDWESVTAAIPSPALPVLRQAALNGLCRPGCMDAPLRCLLLQSTPEQIAAWPGAGEGLEMRFLRAARSAVTRDDLLQSVKTRRYTLGRLSRCLCHGLLGVTASDLPAEPAAARILGFRESARSLLKAMKSRFPIYDRPAREPAAALDSRADELWHALAGIPTETAYRSKPVIVE